MVCEKCHEKNEEDGFVEFQGDPIKVEYLPDRDGQTQGRVRIWYNCQCEDCGKKGVGYNEYQLPDSWECMDFADGE